MMARWIKASGEPLTTERRVRVQNTESGEEGFVSVSWENRYHTPRFYGPVIRLLEVVYPADGSEPYQRSEVIDNDPVFV